jgi:hypothetical protein
VFAASVDRLRAHLREEAQSSEEGVRDVLALEAPTIQRSPGGAATLPAPIPTTTTRPCPTGRPVATVSTFTVTPNPIGGPGSGIWDVVVGGTVTNNTSGSITLAGLDVVVKDGAGTVVQKTYGSTQANEIAPHGSTSWGLNTARPITIFGQTSDAPPPASADALLNLWFWNAEFSRCPTG